MQAFLPQADFVVLTCPLVPETHGLIDGKALGLMPPSAFLVITGLRAEVQFLKDALAKVGLAAEVEAVSPYKAAGEMFVRSDMSPENRAQLERLLDLRFAEIVQTISAARGRCLTRSVPIRLVDCSSRPST